jgi:hypothetical protein
MDTVIATLEREACREYNLTTAQALHEARRRAGLCVTCGANNPEGATMVSADRGTYACANCEAALMAFFARDPNDREVPEVKAFCQRWSIKGCRG